MDATSTRFKKRAVIEFLKMENVKLTEIHHPLPAVCGTILRNICHEAMKHSRTRI